MDSSTPASDARTTDPAGAAKRPYQAPQLTRHGSVFQLTTKVGSCPSPDLVFGVPKSSSHSKC